MEEPVVSVYLSSQWFLPMLKLDAGSRQSHLGSPVHPRWDPAFFCRDPSWDPDRDYETSQVGSHHWSRVKSRQSHPGSYHWSRVKSRQSYPGSQVGSHQSYPGSQVGSQQSHLGNQVGSHIWSQVGLKRPSHLGWQAGSCSTFPPMQDHAHMLLLVLEFWYGNQDSSNSTQIILVQYHFFQLIE